VIVFDCKVIETRLQVSYFLLSACFFLHVESLQQTIIAIEEDFEECKVELRQTVNKAILIARHPV